MEIFISWSGLKSRAVAQAFNSLLPDLFVGKVSCWISSENIDPGVRWSKELFEKLEKSSFGIICVTQQNLNAPWIQFEAGNIAKVIEKSKVCPILIDLSPSGLKENPLHQFQAIGIQKDDIYKIVKLINKDLGSEDTLSKDILERNFKRWWPDFKKILDNLPEEKLRIFDSSENISNNKIIYSRNLKQYICYHQGNLIQYLFLAGEYHKELKDELRKKRKNINLLKEKCSNLLAHLDECFAEIIFKSFADMQKMFSSRHAKSPRICLKVNIGDNGKKVIPLYREESVNYKSDCKFHENTGFLYIKENGKFFLCQNIPEDAKNGSYVNPRLIKNRIRSYTPKHDKKGYVDKNWVKCWRGSKSKKTGSVDLHYTNCYKSTLIIPLTLWNNKMVEKFYDRFNLKNFDARTIFGYLCFDHITIDYFDPIFDVDSGYVFADILSLYLLIRFVFVNQSGSYKAAYTYLKDHGFDLSHIIKLPQN